jgi:hypothetical protein
MGHDLLQIELDTYENKPGQRSGGRDLSDEEVLPAVHALDLRLGLVYKSPISTR